MREMTEWEQCVNVSDDGGPSLEKTLLLTVGQTPPSIEGFVDSLWQLFFQQKSCSPQHHRKIVE